MNGSASRALTRRTIRRGSSSHVYDAERSNDVGVRGSPNANNDDRRVGRGGRDAKELRSWVKSAEGGEGVQV